MSAPTGYRRFIEWIALNDETTETNIDELCFLISVSMVADVFGKPAKKVAADVTAYRQKNPS